MSMSAPISSDSDSLRNRIHSKLEGKPIKLLLNIATIIMALLMDAAVILGLISLSVAPLHWIVAAYLVFGSVLLILASLPAALRIQIIFKYFLFLSTYNGKSAFMIFVSVLLFGLGTFAIIVGVFMTLLAVLHFIMWLLFRDLVGDPSSKEISTHDTIEHGRIPPHFTDYTYSGALGGHKETSIGGYEVATTVTVAPITQESSGSGFSTGPTYGAIGSGVGKGTETIPGTYDSSSDSDEERFTK